MTLPEAKENLIALACMCNSKGIYDDESAEAVKVAIKSLEAWEKLRTEIMAIGNWRNESEISDNGVKDCLAIIDRHIAEIRGD